MRSSNNCFIEPSINNRRVTKLKSIFLSRFLIKISVENNCDFIITKRFRILELRMFVIWNGNWCRGRIECFRILLHILTKLDEIIEKSAEPNGNYSRTKNFSSTNLKHPCTFYFYLLLLSIIYLSNQSLSFLSAGLLDLHGRKSCQ